MSKAFFEHYTYEDYCKWEGDWELIDGHPYAMAPSPMKTHQSIAYEIARIVGNEVEDCEDCEVLGEVDYKINSDTVLRPDVVLTCGEINEKHLSKAPKIVFEVISPATAKRDEVYKFEIYEEEGVKYYCLVYPDELKVKIYKLKDNKYQKEGDFTYEKYHFKDIECEVEIDFQKVFKRFTKKV